MFIELALTTTSNMSATNTNSNVWFDNDLYWTSYNTTIEANKLLVYEKTINNKITGLFKSIYNI